MNSSAAYTPRIYVIHAVSGSPFSRAVIGACPFVGLSVRALPQKNARSRNPRFIHQFHDFSGMVHMRQS